MKNAIGILLTTLLATVAHAQPYIVVPVEFVAVKTTFGMSETEPAVGIAGGYRLTKALAVEGALFNVEEINTREVGPESGGSVIATSHRYGVRGLGVFLVGNWPVADSITLFARAGLYGLRTELRTHTRSALTSAPFTETTISDTTDSDSIAAPAIGLGIEYAVSDRVRFRGLVQHIEGDGTLERITTFGGGIAISF